MKYCLGTVQFGLNYGIQDNGKPSKEEIFNILDASINNGIKIFDTAAAYGDSEAVLGDYFNSRHLNYNTIKVISKISSNIVFQNNDNKTESALAEELSKNVNISLNNLKIDKLYGLLYHDSTSVFDEQRIKILEKIKSTGIVDKVGISIYTPDEALKALDYNIDIIQVPYNVFDQRLDKVNFFNFAKEKGIEIFARSSLLQGLALMDSNKLPNKVIFAKEYISNFENLCKQYNVGKLEAAITYVASNSKIDYIVFGVDNIGHLFEYISFMNNRINDDFLNDLKVKFNNTNLKLVNPSLW